MHHSTHFFSQILYVVISNSWSERNPTRYSVRQINYNDINNMEPAYPGYIPGTMLKNQRKPPKTGVFGPPGGPSAAKKYICTLPDLLKQNWVSRGTSTHKV